MLGFCHFYVNILTYCCFFNLFSVILFYYRYEVFYYETYFFIFIFIFSSSISAQYEFNKGSFVSGYALQNTDISYICDIKSSASLYLPVKNKEHKDLGLITFKKLENLCYESFLSITDIYSIYKIQTQEYFSEYEKAFLFIELNVAKENLDISRDFLYNNYSLNQIDLANKERYYVSIVQSLITRRFFERAILVKFKKQKGEEK